MSGDWIAPAAEEHRCSLPIMWPWIIIKPGDRWRCADKLETGERCGKVWRVVWGDGRREWTEDAPAPGGLTVFRPVTDEQLWFRLTADLAKQADVQLSAVQQGRQLFPARQVVEAIRRYFEIGSKA